MRDPVCGTELSLTVPCEETYWRGWRVYFCSPECRWKFERNSEDYRIDHAETIAGEMHKFEI